MNRPSPTTHLPLLDALKALASQLIVWHHLAFYGPMSDVVHPHAPALIEWLYDHGRLAVQVFLVVAGFLAARSLAPAMAPLAGPGPLQLIWRRYRRLAPPYLAALALAMLAAALARWLIDHPTIPAAPSLVQIGAHILMLQDVLKVEALSAGVWYVAIDLQLYALLALVLWLLRPVATRHPAAAPWLTLVVCAGLVAASLFWFNRNPALDEWAPYFFGARLSEPDLLFPVPGALPGVPRGRCAGPSLLAGGASAQRHRHGRRLGAQPGGGDSLLPAAGGAPTRHDLGLGQPPKRRSPSRSRTVMPPYSTER